MIPVSLLSSYSYCPRKIFLERVLKFVDFPKEFTLKGNIRHAAFDRLNKSEQEIVSTIDKSQTLEQVEEMYRNLVAKAIRASIIESKATISRLRLEPSEVQASVMKRFAPEIETRAKNVHSFMQKTGLEKDELWLELTPKIRSEYRISSESLNLSGIIDQVHVAEDKLLPVELKTGKTPQEGLWPGHRIQLAAYIMLLEDKFDLSLTKGTVKYLDTGDDRELLVNPFMREEVISTRIKVENILNNAILPDRVKNEKKCEKCALKDDCFNDSMVQARLEKIT